MSRNEHRAAYWRLFGSRRGQEHFPRFSAVAFLNEACRASEKDLVATRDELLGGNSRMYGLSVMFYRKASNGIDVAREIPERKPRHGGP